MTPGVGSSSRRRQLASQTGWKYGMVLDPAVTQLYFANNADSGIRKVSTTTPGATPLVGAEQKPGAILVDATKIFWLDTAGVRSLPVAGAAAPSTVADLTGTHYVNSFVADPTHLYWFASGPATVYSVPKTGGAPVPVVDMTNECGNNTGGVVALDGDRSTGTAACSSSRPWSSSSGPSNFRPNRRQRCARRRAP
jgi:hypothetical protein